MSLVLEALGRGVPRDAMVMRLDAIIEQLQTAPCGSKRLDALLSGLLDDLQPLVCVDQGCAFCVRAIGSDWSTSLTDAIGLLPQHYNYSLGERDGVSWAWLQPNDRWQPQDHESRHDHPGGSGLVVAHSAALAITCAVMILHSRRLGMAGSPGSCSSPAG